jgi:hypothetical protein
MTPDPYDKDFDETAEATPNEGGGRPIVRHIVKDLATAVKMKKVQADADARARAAEAASALATVRAEERRRKQELKGELSRIRLAMSAGEKARAHIAIAGPLYLLILIGGFIVMLSTGAIPADQVSVASALLTLLVTMIGANLRSIISESPVVEEPSSNGQDPEDVPAPASPPQPKDPYR